MLLFNLMKNKKSLFFSSKITVSKKTGNRNTFLIGKALVSSVIGFKLKKEKGYSIYSIIYIAQ